jgi:uncharacterized protein YprB with RNaseH-like and TPR domain
VSSRSGGISPDLCARLARLGVSLGPAGPASVITLARPDVVPIEAAVPGAPLANACGQCYVSSARYLADAHHGNEALRSALSASLAALACLCQQSQVQDMDLASAGFVDLETTGLVRGSGTYAFLIGAGRFQGEVFVVRQLFMRDPSEERAQLAALEDWLADVSGVVTFNGRSFDIPMLECRQAFHDLPRFLAGRPHLDLLPAARRLWKRRLGDCSLVSLERHVLGFGRQDDVPGWLVPERYLTYQQTGDARGLVGVFQHNLLDVLSMVGLTARMARAFASPHTVLAHGHEWLGLARVYERAGQRAAVVGAYESALATGLDTADADEALRRLAWAARQMGDWQRAVEVWEAMASAACPRRLFPFEELAKYYEHHARPRDLERALDLAQRARDHVTSGILRPARGRGRSLADLERRITRLQRRLDSSGAWRRATADSS